MIRPTFLSFETAKRALAIGQLGLDTVGHNISNAQTPGYTRQRVDQVSINSAGYQTKYNNFGVQFPGQGSDINGITQIRDPYLDNRYRAEATTYGELSIKDGGLTDINNIFDEILSNGLHYKMGDLYNTLDRLMNQADSKDLAAVVRNTANELVQILHENAKSLRIAREQQTSDLKNTVESEVNVILAKIADLNVRIKEDNFYGNPSNELNDERNLLIDRLSEYVDIKVIRTPIKIADDLTVEQVSIELKDSGNSAKGIPNVKLVDSGSYNKFAVDEDPETGNVKIKLVDGVSDFEIDLDNDYSNGLNSELTGSLYKGALKGYIDVINGGGPNVASGNTYRGIPYYQAALDDFASKLAETFNRINNITAQEAADSGTPPLVTETFQKNLFNPGSYTMLQTPSPNWISSFTGGTLPLSGGFADISFTTDDPTNTNPTSVTASVTVDGVSKTYTAEYTAGNALEFKDDTGSVAFTIHAESTPADGSSLTLDTRVTASNLSVSQAWINDSLYMTATKFNPVTEAKSSLEIAGTPPSWLKSIEISNSSLKVPDGSYKFYSDGAAAPNTKICVDIGGVTYSALMSDMKANSNVLLKDPGGVTGLILTTSSTPTFNNDPAKDTASLKNVTAAASDNIGKFKDAFAETNSYAGCSYSGTFEGFLVNMQKDMSLDKEMNSSMLDGSLVVIGGLADRRDAVSAVNVDEEGISMMRYQNFYNAAARYMTTLDEALDKIINGMGTVGR